MVAHRATQQAHERDRERLLEERRRLAGTDQFQQRAPHPAERARGTFRARQTLPCRPLFSGEAEVRDDVRHGLQLHVAEAGRRARAHEIGGHDVLFEHAEVLHGRHRPGLLRVADTRLREQHGAIVFQHARDLGHGPRDVGHVMDGAEAVRLVEAAAGKRQQLEIAGDERRGIALRQPRAADRQHVVGDVDRHRIDVQALQPVRTPAHARGKIQHTVARLGRQVHDRRREVLEQVPALVGRRRAGRRERLVQVPGGCAGPLQVFLLGLLGITNGHDRRTILRA